MGRKPKISVEEKVFICEQYLNGIKSLGRLAKDNGINTETIRRWINQYREYGSNVFQPKAHNKNYKETAEIFDVSYAQVYQWIKKYSDSGEEGLADKRGKRKEAEQLSETEILQRKVKILERQLKEKEMENELLKKVKEIERRRYCQKRKTKRNTWL